MIEVMPESEGNMLVLWATGRLTDQDYKDVLIPRMENIIREHGKARLVMDMSGDFRGWQVAAMWDDFRFGMAHRHDFERMAIVGGPRCVEWGTKLAKLMMSGEIQCFPPNAREDAIAWSNQQEPAVV